MIKIGELKMSLWNELEEMFETSGNSIKVYNAKVKTSGVIEKIGVTTNSVTWMSHLQLGISISR